MRNHITIFQIVLGLAVVAAVIFLLTQPAAAYHGGMSSNHGPTLGPSGGNPGGHGLSNVGGTKGNPVIHPNVKAIKTEKQCHNNCIRGGMREDFCTMACAGY